MSERYDIEMALQVADGVLLTLFAVLANKEVASATYVAIQEDIWAQFEKVTGWSQDEIDAEISRRAGY
jgi:hypothetical protein